MAGTAALSGAAVLQSDLSLRERLTLQVIARARLPLAEERAELEGSLISFVESAWLSLDPSAFQACWAIDALCEHLQAVTEGQIKKLLVNFPPRCGKTLVTSVCFPAWTWARSEQSYLSGPQVRFLCGSYNDDLSLQNSTKHRRLLLVVVPKALGQALHDHAGSEHQDAI